MAEQILDSFPDMSGYDVGKIKLKPLNSYVKSKIIEANPQFASLKWEHFRLSVDTPQINQEQNGFERMNVRLYLSVSSDIRRYYRSDVSYNFTYDRIDTASYSQSLFEGLHGKTFKYELKDQFQSTLDQVQTLRRISGGSVTMTNAIQISDNEEIHFISFQNFWMKNDRNEDEYQTLSNTTAALSGNGIFIDGLSSLNKDTYLAHKDFYESNFVWVRFKRDEIREEDMINTPDQPVNSTLNTRFSEMLANQ